MEKDKIINIDFLKVNYSRNKFCKCYESYPTKIPKYVIDYRNRIVECAYCHIIVDPFDALYKLALYYETIQSDIEHAKEYRKELMNYKPYLKSIKKLESNIRNGKMIPVCPKCKKGFDVSEINTYINKEFYKE